MISKNKKLVALSATLTVATTVGLVVAAYSSNNLKNLSKVSGDSIEKTIDNNALSQVTFDSESLDIVDNRRGGTEIKHEKKFRIPLDNGKYILGALIYHDCGNQYIGTPDEVNASLGDALTMNNYLTEEEKEKEAHGEDPGRNKAAYNFHIAFALDNVDAFSFNYTALYSHDSESPEGETYFFHAIKIRQYDNDGTDNSFYNDLSTAGYDSVLENNNDYYSVVDKGPGIPSRWIEVNQLYNEDVTLNRGDNSANMVIIQFNDSGKNLDPGRKISFTLNKLEFTYHCN